MASCGGIGVAQMLRQQARDVDAAEEVELRRLEGHPEACRLPCAVAVLAAARVVADGASTRPSPKAHQLAPGAGVAGGWFAHKLYSYIELRGLNTCSCKYDHVCVFP